jgi:hypothetical protein
MAGAVSPVLIVLTSVLVAQAALPATPPQRLLARVKKAFGKRFVMRGLASAKKNLYLGGFCETVLYVYLCVRAHYTFRDSTFGITGNRFWEVLPAYLAVRLVRAVSVRLGSATGSGDDPVPPLPPPLAADGVA